MSVLNLIIVGNNKLKNWLSVKAKAIKEECMIIYKVTNLINNKIYIGQTVSSLEIRKSQHERSYSYGYRNAFPRAINKYGKENFKWEIIDTANSLEELNEKENYYIGLYQSTNRKKGYNLKCGGNNKFLDDTVKQKIGDAQRGELNHMYGKTGDLNPTSKRVKNITTGEIFGSSMECARELGLNFSHVSAVCRGSRKSTGKMVFRYLDEDGKVIEPIIISKPKRINRKKVMNIDTGEVFNSATEAEIRYFGKKIGSINKACKGKHNKSAGYRWKFVD